MITAKSTGADLMKAMEWIVVVNDRPNMLAKRISVRPRHSLHFAKLHQEGYVSWAGPLFNEHVGPAQQRPFKGSALVLNNKSAESIRSRLAGDVYVSEGVWDVENALIMPFRTLMRKNPRDMDAK